MTMTGRKKPAFVTIRATRAQVRRMSEWVSWIQERRGYRYIARFAGRTHGYWQHIATRDGQCKPTIDDYNTLKRVYEILREGANLDAEMVAALLEVMEHRGQMDAALARLMALVRKRNVK